MLNYLSIPRLHLISIQLVLIGWPYQMFHVAAATGYDIHSDHAIQFTMDEIVSHDSSVQVTAGTVLTDITVYNYNGAISDAAIGRVSLDSNNMDKICQWDDTVSQASRRYFEINGSTGIITMREGTPEGIYLLHFIVTERFNDALKCKISKKVKVTVKKVLKKHIDRSGSFRFRNVTGEQFLAKEKSSSTAPKERLEMSIASALNVTQDKVVIFSIQNEKDQTNQTILNVRYLVYGLLESVYLPQFLNTVLTGRKQTLEQIVGFPVLQVGIDECIPNSCGKNHICNSKLHVSSTPITIHTEGNAFTGVNITVQKECVDRKIITCLNGGSPVDDHCSCLKGFEGPKCEKIEISFEENGYAIYPLMDPDNITSISMELAPNSEDGLVLYIGPWIVDHNPEAPALEFLALELIAKRPVLWFGVGGNIERLRHPSAQLRNSFSIGIVIFPDMVQLIVDGHKMRSSTSRDVRVNQFTNSILHLGDSSIYLNQLGARFNWTDVAQSKGFAGTIRNLKINNRTYDLGQPSLAKLVSWNAETINSPRSPYTLMIIISFVAGLIWMMITFVVRKHRTGRKQDDSVDDIKTALVSNGSSDFIGICFAFEQNRKPTLSAEERKLKNKYSKIDFPAKVFMCGPIVHYHLSQQGVN
ncbi:DE-cadherin-like [Anopheles arabiensis]|uniref:DE-cadherin-like n=1 Tax=Anopheles arabiensis TaxID=7173 RepID=UPI001AAC8491|nr:DE-cadherin-like [Anopheles arabiensis]